MTNDTPSSLNTSNVRHDAENLADLFPDLLVEAETLAHSVAIGFHGRKRAGSGENFWQHRPYTFGDSVSSIDWRQSARSANRLYIRQNEWEAAASVWLWRDPSASMLYSSQANNDEKLHRATVIASALSILLAQAGERIGVFDAAQYAGGSSRLYHGRGAPEKILENLGHTHNETTAYIPVGENIRAGNHIVLISDFFMEAEHIAEAINHYVTRGAQGILCQVLDPAELLFPFRGRTEFLDMESSSSLIFGNSGALQKEYLEKLHAHQEKVRSICAHAGWPFCTHTTDTPAQEALIFMMEMLSEKKPTETMATSTLVT